jgi:hypothetical protein
MYVLYSLFQKVMLRIITIALNSLYIWFFFIQVINGEGTWVQLDKDTMRKFCFNIEGEAWSLALSRSDVVYLRKDGVVDEGS